ncbi:hypothetical protein MKY96_21555 [Paenibacillus sp. FSL R7-0302]|uniref:hypothetical protein n=1 Tax=Paenibacillus sp. FSL R7-0302 TaxID=2921681 RepID=UPI0030F7895B
MIKLQIGDTRHKCSYLPVFEREFLTPLKWGEKDTIAGIICEFTDSLQIINQSFIYCESVTPALLNKIRAGSHCIKAIFSKEIVPVQLYGVTDLPYLFTLHAGAAVNGCSQAILEIDLTDYLRKEYDTFDLMYWKAYEVEHLHHRLTGDFTLVENYLGITRQQRLQVIFAKDINDLSDLTGQNSSFAYRNLVVGLTYKLGKYRPELHEYTHILLYNWGSPPFLFVEGMATLISDLLLINENNRKSFDILSKVFLKKYPVFHLKELFTVDYKSENFHIHMYHISASFVYYLIRIFGLDKVKEGYQIICRKNGLSDNLSVFQSLFGQPLEMVEKEWLTDIGIQVVNGY